MPNPKNRIYLEAGSAGPPGQERPRMFLDGYPLANHARIEIAFSRRIHQRRPLVWIEAIFYFDTANRPTVIVSLPTPDRRNVTGEPSEDELVEIPWITMIRARWPRDDRICPRYQSEGEA